MKKYCVRNVLESHFHLLLLTFTKKCSQKIEMSFGVCVCVCTPLRNSRHIYSLRFPLVTVSVWSCGAVVRKLTNCLCAKERLEHNL
jgi:hypothetical protein